MELFTSNTIRLACYVPFDKAAAFLARFGLMNRMGRLARRLAYDV